MINTLDIDGTKLKQAREKAGLTPTQVAETIGITRAHLSHLENDKRQPSNRLADELAALYGVRIFDLLKAPERILLAA
jgi:putative transcriptional regulator